MEKVLSQAWVQIRIANHHLSQDDLLKLRQEGGIHGLFGDNNSARLKSLKRNKTDKRWTMEVSELQFKANVLTHHYRLI